MTEIKPEQAILQLGDPICDEIARVYPFDLGEDIVSGPPEYGDLVNGSDLTLPGSSSLQWGIDEHGRLIEYDGVGSITLAYAESQDPFITDVDDDLGFSIMWTGIIPSSLSTASRFAMAGLGSSTTLGHYAYLNWNNVLSGNLIEWSVSKSGGAMVSTGSPPKDRRFVAIGVYVGSRPAGETLKLFVDGEMAQGDAGSYSGGATVNRFHINANDESGLRQQSIFSCHTVACWRRALADDEAQRLTLNPDLIIWPDATRDLLALPYYRQLTQPAFPVISRTAQAIDQTSARQAGVLIAAKANRINERELRVRLSTLNQDERSLLQDLYDEGRGLVEPFWVNIPNEGARRFIVKTPNLAITDRSAVNAEAILELIDVTNPLDF